MARKKSSHIALGTSLDDIVSGNLGDASAKLNQWAGHMKKGNQQGLLMNTTAPGEELYMTSFNQALIAKFGDDPTTSLHGKEDEVQEFITEVLLDYFKLVSPETIQALNEMESDLDSKQKYDILSAAWDRRHGTAPGREGSIAGLVARATRTRGPQSTVGGIYEEMFTQHSQNAIRTREALNAQIQTGLLGGFDPLSLSALAMKKSGESGYEVEDPTSFVGGGAELAAQIYERAVNKPDDLSQVPVLYKPGTD